MNKHFHIYPIYKSFTGIYELHGVFLFHSFFFLRTRPSFSHGLFYLSSSRASTCLNPSQGQFISFIPGDSNMSEFTPAVFEHECSETTPESESKHMLGFPLYQP